MAKKGKKGKKSKRGGVPRTNLDHRLSHTSGGGPMVELNDGNFGRVVSGDTPVLVDFWAPWCGPCKAMAPVLEQLAEDRRGALHVAKYNTEVNSVIATDLKIRSIPTLALFRGGEVVDVHVGAMKKAALVSWIDKALTEVA